MLEYERLRTRIVDMRVHVLEKGFVERDEIDVKRAYTQGIDHAVAVIGIVYMDEADLVARGSVFAFPRVQNDRLVFGGRFLVKVLRKRLRAGDTVFLFRALDDQGRFFDQLVASRGIVQGHRFLTPNFHFRFIVDSIQTKAYIPIRRHKTKNFRSV
jgi:hypothetical protein